MEVEKLRNPRDIEDLFYRMFVSGLLTRPPKQGDHLYGPGEIVHALGNLGADVLDEQGILARGNENWQRRGREAGEKHILHMRTISRVRMALNLSLPADEVNFTDQEAWIPENPGLRLEVYLDDQAEPASRTPDGFFRLNVPGGRYNFVLECQRNNSEKKRFLPWLKVYWYGREQYYEQLGIKRFRVLWLGNSEQRRDHMLKIAREGLNDGQGSSLFLFAAENNPRARMQDPERCFNLADPRLSVLRATVDSWRRIFCIPCLRTPVT